MMRVRPVTTPNGTALIAEIVGHIGIQTDPLDRDGRVLQARALIDAATALLDDGTDDYAAAFERLHDVLDDLPEERREPDDG